MPKVKCPNCHGEYEVHESIIGQRVECPDCKTEFVAEKETPLPKKANSVQKKAKENQSFGKSLWRGICKIIVFLILAYGIFGAIVSRNLGLVAVIVFLCMVCEKLDAILTELKRE